ncbi:MAG TPA: hypothetical protein VIV60_10520 [Polyangiaceae bacterium]
MRAKAPGKVVISGAYSVLESAPAIVAAVDRYVTADTSLRGELLTDEVRAAGIDCAYWFDANELRHADRKLGLGSSAAILVATLAALEWEQSPELDAKLVAKRVYPKALEAHRAAQAGGSGIDVASSCFGGVLGFARRDDKTDLLPLRMPSGLVFEIWASRGAASTAKMLATLRDYARALPSVYRSLMGAQAQAAQRTSSAWQLDDTEAILEGLVAQRHALGQLGNAAGIPIVTSEVQVLANLAEANGSVVLPAGAGGGDIALFVGRQSSEFMLRAISEAQHIRLPVQFGAAGVQHVPASEKMSSISQ